MKRMKMTTLAVAMLCAGAAPASAQSREQRQMMADIRMLQEQTQELAVAIATMTQALQDSIKARQYASRHRERRDAQGVRRPEGHHRRHGQGHARHPRACRRYQRPRLERARGDRGASNARSRSRRRQRASAGSVERSERAAAAPAPTTGAPPSTAGLSPTRMFETARADYAAGQWSLAVTGFDAFLKTFPRSEMADDAQFLIGETLLRAKSMDRRDCRIQCGDPELPDGQRGARGALQARAGAGAPRTARCRARIVEHRDPGRRPTATAGRLAKQNLDRVARRPTP